MTAQIAEIDMLLSQNFLDKALGMVDRCIGAGEGNLDELYFYRGKINWRRGLNALAITDFEHALAINPDSKARHALEMARDVTDFFNPDLLNP